MVHQPDTRRRGEGEGQALRPPADTIAAIATPPGRGGIGVVRISGRQARAIAQGVTGRVPEARHATLADFRAADGGAIDRGLAVFFPEPHSYTGEDVLELQGHGGPVVMRQLLRRCVELGARIAEPGEFTRRAFLNDRLDLAQAESVADLIDASSVEAARSAARSLAGEFSARVHALVEALTELRMHVEACIDFPEEEIDADDRRQQADKLAGIRVQLAKVLADAEQGAVLREGLTVVLIGPPNVGKSSLLNRLAGDDVAIVTALPGTTRDYVRATVSIEGVPIHLVDTAGLRASQDEVERLGIERTWRAVETAGAALFISEGDDEPGEEERAHIARLPANMPVVYVINKIDVSGATPGIDMQDGRPVLRLSARTGAGLMELRQWLLGTAGWKPHGEGLFVARERHLRALEEAGSHVTLAQESCQAFELMAENLRLAQVSLSRITGEVGADDLLGAIFSRFCIGK